MQLGVTCHLHFWQNGCSLLHATVIPQGGTDIKYESAQKVTSGEENSPAAPAGIQAHNFLIMGLAHYQKAIPAPIRHYQLQNAGLNLTKKVLPHNSKSMISTKQSAMILTTCSFKVLVRIPSANSPSMMPWQCVTISRSSTHRLCRRSLSAGSILGTEQNSLFCLYTGDLIGK